MKLRKIDWDDWELAWTLGAKFQSKALAESAPQEAGTRTTAWRPEVEPLRKLMMAKFSDELSMEEIASRCYRAAEILNPSGAERGVPLEETKK